jgi:hypothetical protein
LLLYTPGVAIVAVSNEVTNEEADKDPDVRSTNAHPAYRIIIPPKHAERKNILKMATAMPIPLGSTRENSITVVDEDTSSPIGSTSHVPRINATKSTKAQHLHRMLL